MVIREPGAYKLLADETRRKILYLLRVKEMNVNQLAEELGLTSQAVYHHIRMLLKGKMVEVAREERTGHLIESYYRATAEDFLLSSGKINAKRMHDKNLAEDEVTAVLGALKNLGFQIEFDPDKVRQIVNLQDKLEQCCTGTKKEELEDKIWNMEELDLQARRRTVDFVGTLLMSENEFSNQLGNRRKFRHLLLSLVKK
jgi:DNA-binding transcriptional ArsR family regulator